MGGDTGGPFSARLHCQHMWTAHKTIHPSRTVTEYLCGLFSSYVIYLLPLCVQHTYYSPTFVDHTWISGEVVT